MPNSYFRQEQWRSAWDKRKRQKENAELASSTPTGNEDIYRQRLPIMDRKPKATAPMNYRTVQQGTLTNIEKQLQERAPEGLKNISNYPSDYLSAQPSAAFGGANNQRAQRGISMHSDEQGYEYEAVGETLHEKKRRDNIISS